MTEAEPVFVLRRPFGWGILMIVDPSRSTWPEPTGGVVGNDAGIVVPVRHADDVHIDDGIPFDTAIAPAVVEVECFVDAPPEREVAFDGVLELGSGKLLIGDAEGGYELRLRPGRWRVQVAADAPPFAEHVRLWVTPAP